MGARLKTQTRALPVIAAGTCGGCSACCTVEALATPAGAPCPHEARTRCSAHPKRPSPCRRFACLWLEGVSSLFPPRTGLVLSRAEVAGVVVLVAREAHEQAVDRALDSGVLLEQADAIDASAVLARYADGAERYMPLTQAAERVAGAVLALSSR